MKSVVVFRSVLPRASEGFVTASLPYLRSWKPVLVGWSVDGSSSVMSPWSRVSYSDHQSLGIIDRARWRLGYHPASAIAAIIRSAPLLCHAHFGDDGAIALPLARRLGVPLLVSFYGHDVTRLPTWRTRRLAWLHYAARFAQLRADTQIALAYSEFLADRLRGLGWPADRVRVLHPGVPLPPQPVWDPASKVVLAVGRLVEKKGFDVLLAAVALLQDRGRAVPVAVLGDGPLRRKLRVQAARLGIESLVHFAGWVPSRDLPQWYRRAAFLVAPSRRAGDGDMEGLPTVLVEAAASGLPLLGTRHAGIPELVREGETGLLVPEADPIALANAIEKLLDETNLRGRLGGAARHLVASEFSLQRQAERLEDTYDEITAAVKGPWQGQHLRSS